MSLTNKTAVITGASRGIGAATALKLASEGCNIAAICAGNIDRAEDICAQCREMGVHAKAYICNVANFDDCKALSAQIKEDFGTVDILVNNAGINRDKLLIGMREADFEDVIDVNLKGTFNMIRHFSPIMIRARKGRIINIASVAGIMGNAGQANYAASKAGIIGLTKSVARELAVKEITCNAIAPGFIATDMTKDFTDDNPLVASIPMKRMGKPEEVASLIAFLASDNAAYITGEVIRIDGGIAI